jgi:hypothetical protein
MNPDPDPGGQLITDPPDPDLEHCENSYVWLPILQYMLCTLCMNVKTDREQNKIHILYSILYLTRIGVCCSPAEPPVLCVCGKTLKDSILL